MLSELVWQGVGHPLLLDERSSKWKLHEKVKPHIVNVAFEDVPQLMSRVLQQNSKAFDISLVFNSSRKIFCRGNGQGLV